MHKELERLLERDRLRNINIIYFLENYQLKSYDIEGESLLFRAKSDREWVMISSSNASELRKLILKLNNNDKYFAFLEEWMIPLVSDERTIDWKLNTMQYYLPDDISIPDKQHTTQSLNKNDAEFIISNSDYGEYLSAEYVRDRINTAPSSGIYIDDKLVAWIHTHDDMAIGSLHVMPEYRRKGFGISLTIDMINKIRDLGKLPFVYIEPANQNSAKLVQKLGFVEHKSINWLAIS